MRILRIGGKNLASLAGEFSVDFEQEPLASTGLFAISGPTGAGKSTLLDALCLALYDDTPRLLRVSGRSMLADVGSESVSTQDTRTLLRRGTAEGYAEVDFVGSDSARYRARWSVRRSRTRVEGALQPTSMTLHLLPALQAIGATKTEVKAEIERRIGLSFEQFTRAVLLAQNEFSAFLKSEDNERGELLETLTGSTIYTDISMRAFERAKQEQLALQKLSARLADQKPLSADERAALDAQDAAASAALQAIEQRKTGLEQELRWHQQAAALQQDELAAQQASELAAAEVQAAAPRRAALAHLVAVQPARALADETLRLDAEQAATQAVIDAGAQTVANAAQALEQANSASAQAASTLEQAEHAQRAAGPQLDQAKALDARIEAMLPAYRQAQAACEKADNADTAARNALQYRQNERRRLESQLEAGSAWLAQHKQWQTLAESWERWDVLFVQAGHAAAKAETLNNQLALIQRNGKGYRAQEADATTRLANSVVMLETLEARRQDASRTLAALDPERLHDERSAWQQRRDLLASGEKIWLDLWARQQRSAQIDAQVAPLRAAAAQAEKQLALAQQQGVAIFAASAQAERSLRLAQAACADNVETLRAALEDDTPCPVCGAHDHPYRHSDPALQGMLDSLQDEVTRCRQQMEANVNDQAAQRASEQASLEQLAVLAVESDSVRRALEQAGAAWHGHPLQSSSLAQSLRPPADEASRSDWFGAALEAARSALLTLEQQERAQLAARNARDQAQAAYEAAATQHQRLLETAASAKAALAQALADYKALDDQRSEATLAVNSLLADLDPAFSSADIANDEWKDDWKAAPARFHEARQSESRQWLAQRSAHEQRSNALATFDVEMQALHDAVSKAGEDALGVRHAFASADAALRATQQQRMELWNGKEVGAVERQLASAIDQARSQLQARQQQVQVAAQVRTRADEALAQAGQRLEVLRTAAASAATKLADWLAAFQQRQPEADVADIEQLRAMLARPLEDIDNERAALHSIERAADHAATVLKERQRQRAQHQLSAPPNTKPAPDEQPPADLLDANAAIEAAPISPMTTLAQALDALAVERKAAQDSAASAQLALAQDDAKRRQSQAMLDEIAAQEAIEQRWSRLSELIGSADGKKFRNYAQQFTLDVLLGYANAHLHHLSRRYRLERIQNNAAPSLALLVRDQDMGGDMRSVHSLSGGESFLVSLALALGLASLSSNRVRVESLFIDEGFGSLDADTLRVAMDALDGLQAMGRKVGVISHVQEMTERISTRILVQPSAGGRSTVSVS